MRVASTFLIAALLTVSANAQTTYTWTGATDTVWATATNWNPNRTAPAANDILVFDGNQTRQPAISANETVGRIEVTGNTTLYVLNGTSTVALTADGGSPNCFLVSAGDTLTINATGTGGNGQLKIGTGGGLDSGTVTILGRAQVLCTDATNRLVFEDGAVFNASQSTGNPFGSSSTGTTNSVEFKSGSTFNHNTGAANPFAMSPPASVVIFDEGSLYSFNLTSGYDPFGVSLSGRTYPNLTFGGQGAHWAYTGSGSGTCTVNGDLTISTGDSLYSGTKHFQVSGDVTNDGYWKAASGDTVIFYNATSGQTISGSGTTVFFQAMFNDTSSNGGFNLGQAILDSGSLVVNGIVSAGMDSIYGPGDFTLSSGSTLYLGGTDGVNSLVKTTGTNSLSKAADYVFDGGGPQFTGTLMPDTVHMLKTFTSTGLTLSKTTTTTFNTTLTGAGSIYTGEDTLFSAVNGGGAGSFVSGNLAYPHFGAIGIWIFHVGQGSTYLPVTINVTACTGNGLIVISPTDLSVTAPEAVPDSLSILKRYFRIGKSSAITALTADLTLSYSDDDVSGIGVANDSLLHVYQYNGTKWVDLPVSSRNVTNNTITISGLNSFGSFIIGLPGPKKVSIAEAREDKDGDFVPDHSVTGDTLMVCGVITSPNYTLSANGTTYFIQDISAGIEVYKSKSLMNFDIGDSVFVIGTIQQYYGMTEIVPLVADLIHFGVLKKGARLPKPKVMTISEFLAGGETYESQLVQINSLEMQSGTWPADGSNSGVYFRALNGTDSVRVFIDKDTDIDGTTAPNYLVNIVGILDQNASSGIGNYSLMPRAVTDIMAAGKIVSISEARKDDNKDFVPDHKATGDTLIVYGIVTSPNMGSYYTSYYIQDTTAGIDVYTGGGVMQFSIGDSVIVIGTVKQNKGLTEISPLVADSAHFSCLKHDAAVPEPLKLSLHEYVANAEEYEGSLIEIDTLYKASGTWGSGENLFLTNAGRTDTATLYINANTNVGESAEPEYPVNVVGIASQYSSSTPANNGYQIIPADSAAIVHVVAVKDRHDVIPKEYFLSQNYPNPFNPTTTIEFGLPKESHVQIAVYNVLGQRVMTLVDGVMKAGSHRIVFNASRLASGVYFYVMRAGDNLFKHKMLMMK